MDQNNMREAPAMGTEKKGLLDIGGARRDDDVIEVFEGVEGIGAEYGFRSCHPAWAVRILYQLAMATCSSAAKDNNGQIASSILLGRRPGRHDPRKSHRAPGP
jgi:hypothetical protein